MLSRYIWIMNNMIDALIKEKDGKARLLSGEG